MGICARFSSVPEKAKEILNDGFLKVFTQIKRYSPDLSFAGWLRRIMINTAIDHYRKNKKYKDSHFDIDQVPEMPDTGQTLTQMHSADIITLVQDLPPAYRMAFTLHVVESYSHKEIAEQLGISVGTSKSNLSKARQFVYDRPWLASSLGLSTSLSQSSWQLSYLQGGLGFSYDLNRRFSTYLEGEYWKGIQPIGGEQHKYNLMGVSFGVNYHLFPKA